MKIYVTPQQLNEIHMLASECDRSPVRQFNEARWIEESSRILQMSPNDLVYRTHQLVIKNEERKEIT